MFVTWAVQGCLAWQQQGLKEPTEVKEATDAYRNEMDHIGRFLHGCCLLKPGNNRVKTQSSLPCKAFCKWAGEYISQTQFSARLTELGYTKKTGGDGRMYWLGIGLVVEPDEDKNTGKYRGL
jgi:putative DNA primase/helicase